MTDGRTRANLRAETMTEIVDFTGVPPRDLATRNEIEEGELLGRELREALPRLWSARPVPARSVGAAAHHDDH